MDWCFDFITCNYRYLGDHEQTVTVKNQDSLDKALTEAVTKLPLGGHWDNHLETEWELVRITPQSWEVWKNSYTNDMTDPHKMENCVCK